MMALLDRAFEFVSKVAQDINDSFWRGIDKLLYG